MKIDSAELAFKVPKVLPDPSHRENAGRIGVAPKGHGGAPRAAQLIEDLVKH